MYLTCQNIEIKPELGKFCLASLVDWDLTGNTALYRTALMHFLNYNSLFNVVIAMMVVFPTVGYFISTLTTVSLERICLKLQGQDFSTLCMEGP